MFSKFGRLGVVAAAIGILVTSAAPVAVSALSIPSRPTDIPIVDQTGTLTDEQKTTLAQQIAAERAKSGNQIAIVIIPTLENESIEEYSLDIAREWGIGTKEDNNGVLLLVAKDDRKLRIEVGTGLEGALTDVQTGRIIRDNITPKFREGKYFEGVQAGLTNIIASINGEYTATTAAQENTGFPWELVFTLGIFGLSWLGSILARTKSWWAGGIVGGAAGGVVGLVAGSLLIGLVGAGILAVIGLIFDKLVSANYKSHVDKGQLPSWWAGGGSLGGGPSGGFGGFGGGGFSGGGSSGSW